MLESFGRTVLSADREAQDLIHDRPTIRRRIVSEFGEDVFGPDGKLDRARLATRAFETTLRTRALNAIVHPALVRALQLRIRNLPRPQRCPYVIIEAALVYETGLNASLDFVIVVDAPRDLRIARVMERDAVDRPDVLRRMQAQLPAETLKERADFVLMNVHDTSSLRPSVAFLDSLLVAMSRS